MNRRIRARSVRYSFDKVEYSSIADISESLDTSNL
jgi:hypothetical protein